MLVVFLQRQRFKGLGNDFASASPASIDARMVGGFSGLILPVELRTDADFYVIAAPKECHGSPSFDEFARLTCGFVAAVRRSAVSLAQTER